jgi:hypothetical protein
MKYKMGDKVWVKFYGGERAGVVLGPNTFHNGVQFPYQVEVPGSMSPIKKFGETWACDDNHLRPRDDPEDSIYDGNKTGSWDGIESLKPNSLKPKKIVKEAA